MVYGRDNKKHVREVEIARYVKSVFEELPVLALMNFVSNLERNVANASEVDPLSSGLAAPPSSSHLESMVNDPWRHLTPANAIDAIAPPSIVAERPPPRREKDNRRLDLVVPVPPFEAFGRAVTSLIFEFKLGQRDRIQLNDYTRLAPSSLVVSISSDADVPPTESSGPGSSEVWVCQTWAHLYFAVREILSGDARARIPDLPSEPGDLLLSFDYKSPGQDRVTFTCERLLKVIQEQGLLPNRELTLVVPIGEYAAQTLKHDPPYYAHPATWQSGYKYLAMIRGNVLMQVYAVSNSAIADSRSDVILEPPHWLPTDEWDKLGTEIPLRVALLDELRDPSLPVGLRYAERGPGGRLKTFTFSHRYVDNLNALREFFTEPV